jgi:hypothetical protein
MKAIALVLAVPLVVLAAGAQEALDAAADKAAPARAPFKLRMDDPAVRDAIRAMLADEPKRDGRQDTRRDGTTLRADPVAGFARKMDEAEVPSCWRGDAMKHQPAKIGPINLGGLLALPFWGAAILRGKCNR